MYIFVRRQPCATTILRFYPFSKKNQNKNMNLTATATLLYQRCIRLWMKGSTLKECSNFDLTLGKFVQDAAACRNFLKQTETQIKTPVSL